MKRTAKDNIGIARMVSVQTISRRSLGYGLNPGTRPPAVSRIIDGHEIYSDRKCDFFLGQPPEDREHIRHHLIGRFYHPSLASTQFDYGGDAKVAVDTRFQAGTCFGSEPSSTPDSCPAPCPGFGTTCAGPKRSKAIASTLLERACSSAGSSTRALLNLTKTTSFLMSKSGGQVAG